MSELWQKLLAEHPAISIILSWFEAIKSAWHSIETFVLFVGLMWIVHRLKRERVKISGLIDDLGQRVDTTGQLASAAREAAETAIDQTKNWETVRGEWQTMRDRIELAIGRIPNKKVSGKYAKIPRYSYYDVIGQLGDDGLLPQKARVALINMNHRFLGFKSNPKGVTSADVFNFLALKREVNGSLPRLPKKKVSDQQLVETTALEAAE